MPPLSPSVPRVPSAPTGPFKMKNQYIKYFLFKNSFTEVTTIKTDKKI